MYGVRCFVFGYVCVVDEMGVVVIIMKSVSRV